MTPDKWRDEAVDTVLKWTADKHVTTKPHGGVSREHQTILVELISEALSRAYAEGIESPRTVEDACDILWDECVKQGAKEFGEWYCSVDGKKFTVRIELGHKELCEPLSVEEIAGIIHDENCGTENCVERKNALFFANKIHQATTRRKRV